MRRRRQAVEVLGHLMVTDRMDALELRRKGIYEAYETEVVTALLRPGETVLDVGAHIGYYTLIMARVVGAEGRVYAFEPDPENFKILRRNVRLNRYRNVVAVNSAVLDRTGNVALYRSTENTGDHRVYDSGDGRAAVKVSCCALDEFFGPDVVVGLVKMDVQGAEWAAVRGMVGLLERSPQVRLITEFWPIGLRRYGVEPRWYLELLRGLGFFLYELDEKQKALVPVEDEELLRRIDPRSEDYTNLLCVRDPLESYGR